MNDEINQTNFYSENLNLNPIHDFINPIKISNTEAGKKEFNNNAEDFNNMKSNILNLK